MGQRQRLAHVLLDEEHGHSVGVDRPYRLEDAPHEHRCQAERRLVEHEQSGPRHQRAADGAHLLLAAGERAGELAGALTQHREE